MLGMEQIVTVLQAAGLGTPGVSLFAYKMPPSVTQGIVVLNPLAGGDIDWDLPGYLKGSFQTIIRAAKIPDGRALALRVSDALSWMAPRTLPANAGVPLVIVKRCLPRHTPIGFPRSDNDLVEFSVNYDYVSVK